MPADLKRCEFCKTRLLIVRDIPPLNYGPDPAGKVAVSFADPRIGRFLARGEQPGPLEHAYSVHECDGQKRAAQRQVWRGAIAGLHRDQRNRRSRRREPEITGYVRPAPPLPGMDNLTRKD